jgi:hypothetical protein
MSPRLLVEVLIFLKREDLLVGVEVNCLTTFSFFITFHGDFWSFVGRCETAWSTIATTDMDTSSSITGGVDLVNQFQKDHFQCSVLRRNLLW